MLVNETLGTELSTTVATAGSFVDWPGENVNLANRSAFADVAEGLHHQLLNSTNYQLSLRKCVCVYKLMYGHVGVGKREVQGGDERGVGGGARRAGRRG